MNVIITGGGWAGCAAAYQASIQGAEVTLLERTDMLLGTGLVGGIMRNNGRYTAMEELYAMGGEAFLQLIDDNCRHKELEFPGHAHASLYDIGLMPGIIASYLKEIGVELCYQTRITRAEASNGRMLAVKSAAGDRYEADVFIDTTGTAGPMNNCSRYGNGCAMCALRCPAFGGRVSLAGLAGISELQGQTADGNPGAMSGSCKLYKESLAEPLVQELNERGVAVVPLPDQLREDHRDQKACQQYAASAYAENLILLDTGHAKLMTPYYPLEKLRRVPGFEHARYEDPYAGGKGNSMRFFAMSPRNNALLTKGMENLFCAGEKAGLLVGHTEAIATGMLAGYNSVKQAAGEELLILPRETAVGEAIAWVDESMQQEAGLREKYTFSGSVLFDHMKQKGLYELDRGKIMARVEAAGLRDIFAAPGVKQENMGTLFNRDY